jgi:MoaA/NifB/PqqE/SkfB family radical SAM enzyme
VKLEIPLHNYSEKGHDQFTRSKGSFMETIEGIKNLYYYNPKASIKIRILIHKKNYQILEAMLRKIFLTYPLLREIIIIYTNYVGNAIDNKDSLFISLKETKKIFQVIRKHKERFKFSLYHFPYCITDRDLWDINKGRTLSRKRIRFFPVCDSCIKKGTCSGIHKSPLNDLLIEEILPIK